MIIVHCSACQARIKAKPEYAGRKVACPKCKAPVVIPRPADPAPAEQLSAGHNEPLQDTAGSSPAGHMEPVAPESVPGMAAFTPAADSTAFPDFSAAAASPPADGPPLMFPSHAATGPIASTPAAFDTTSTPAAGTRRRRRGSGGLLAIVVLFIAAAGGAGWWLGLFDRKVVAVQLDEIADQTVVEGKYLALAVPVKNRKELPGLKIHMVSGPNGATLDPAGKFEWTPTEADGPGKAHVHVQVVFGDATSDLEFDIAVTEDNLPPTVAAVESVDTEVGKPVRFKAAGADPDEPAVKLAWELAEDAPAGAAINADTGEFTWTPADTDEDRNVVFTVVAREVVPADFGYEPQSGQTIVTVRVLPIADPYRSLLTRLKRMEIPVQERDGGGALPFKGKAHVLRINSSDVYCFEYASEDAIQADIERINEDEGQLFGEAWPRDDALNVYRESTLLLATVAPDAETRRLLDGLLRVPFAVIAKKGTPAPEVRQTPELVAALSGLWDERETGAKKKRKLFNLKEYGTVRKVFAEQFVKQNDSQMRLALGADYDDFMDWLNEREDFREELFTAFTPDDDVAAGLTLLKEIRAKFPKDIDRYGSLAIAMAVTWDRERGGVYEYGNHQRRTHSIMPADLAVALDNFDYLVKTESVMQGRIQYVPWEFLTLVVNHRTPLREREWALQNYGAQRTMFGKCYQDVPYDSEMLATESRVCRLDGKDYNLPNIKQFGGVCAMQADFAARVGKSIGIPAAYVSGDGRFGGIGHAWVMWVELKAVSERSITFSLESHGRYRGDRYYVGDLNDPQTGKGITDRQLELKLHQVGMDAAAKRHSDRLMVLYPELASELRFGFEDRMDFISQTMALNPWSEPAWTALSQVSFEETELDKLQIKTMTTALNQLFVNFAPFPDFTLTIFEDLISFEPDAATRVKLWYQLLDVYSAAERPDLAFAALLKLSEKLVLLDRGKEAIQALAVAIQKYPDEGQFVPKMLDSLENLAAEVPGSQAGLVSFYSEFLPKIPQKRGDTPSEYCMDMYRRGIKQFEAAGQQQLAQTWKAQLQALSSQQ